MMFGEQTSTEDALRIIDKAWDQGINFIDTADVYNAGRSEEIVGEAVARHRHDWIVASKVGFGPADGLPNRSGCRASTSSMPWNADPHGHRLPGHLTCTAKTTRYRWRPCGGGGAAGQDPLLGVSNFRGWRIAEVCHVAERLGVPSRWSASRCTTSSTARPSPSNSPPPPMAWACALQPAGPGVLSGKYAPGAVPDAGSRAGRQDKRIMEVNGAESLTIAQADSRMRGQGWASSSSPLPGC
jgi:aryl-alcohol dehydrogenase-like predicted oxidoreductase